MATAKVASPTRPERDPIEAREAPRGAGKSSATPHSSAAHLARLLPRPALTTDAKILDCARRLASSPTALDVLVLSLEKVLAQPDAERFRKIQLSNANFQRTVASAPGGVEFLLAVGYELMHGYLVLQYVRRDVLIGAKAALEAQREGAAYRAAKEQAQQADATEQAQRQRAADKASRRAAHLAKVPAEPPVGEAGSCKICLHVGDVQHWRRFGSWHTLADLAHFAASLVDGEISLSNITTRPAQRLDPATHGEFTLQRLDLWPSGHVQVAVAASA